MTYYLKYRPQKIDDLDLKDVRESLKKIVRSKKIPHAFLFSGPKGSGKTSAARIIAKIVNCTSTSKALRGPGKIEPCNKCVQCVSITNGSNIDVIELDAASHRGIDDVRMLRDAVKLAPALAKKKVYIIDESHMLTTEASNALLKTLEEPPEHVLFILATTNPGKLIATIRSRTVNIPFKKAKASEIVRSLSVVVKGERLKVEKGVLEIIAKAAEGSFRDAVIILEQLVAEKKKLTCEEVGEYLFQKKAFDVDEFLSILARKETKKALTAIENAIEKGANAKSMLKGILERLRESLLVKTGLEGEDLEFLSKEGVVLLIKLFTNTKDEITSSVIDQLPMEIAVIEWCEMAKGKNQNSKTDAAKKTDKALEVNGKNKRKIKKAANNPTHKKSNEHPVMKKARSLEKEIWMRILSNIRPRNASTEALLRASKPIHYDGKTLELGVYYQFHKERLESNFHRTILEEVASEILGNGIRVVCTLAEQLRGKTITPAEVVVPKETQGKAPEVTLTESEDEDIIKVAKEIFGS